MKANFKNNFLLLAYYDYLSAYGREPIDMIDLVDGNKAIEANKIIDNYLIKE